MKRRGLRLLALGSIIGVLLGACQPSGDDTDILPARTPVVDPTSAEGPVIGLVGTMTGPESWRGEDAFEGADLGVHVLNSGLGREDAPYQLVTLDDGGDEEKATELVRQLASSERTIGIVYAGPPEALPESEAALADAGIPALLCFGDLYGRDSLSDHLFQVSPPYLWQARRIASYLVKDRGYRAVGMIVEDSAEGSTAQRAISESLRGLARRIRSSSVTYAPGGDVGQAVTLMKRARVEAVVVQGSPRSFSAAAKSLSSKGSTYRSTAAAKAGGRRRGGATWRPQVIGFDSAISPFVRASLSAGTVASDTYARGAHYLPVPSLAAFRTAFEDWWGDEPLGWEHRAYEATSMIGWAAERTAEGEDVAEELERIRSQRLGGLDVSFGRTDHTSVEALSIGLWVVPRARADVLERRSLPDSMPWVPLGRTFSTDGRRTDIPPEDWPYLFTSVPPSTSAGPRIETARWGVTTSRSDPVH
jgi:ABC-type branched-subunit amino acid transport system substrate-binding protein